MWLNSALYIIHSSFMLISQSSQSLIWGYCRNETLMWVCKTSAFLETTSYPSKERTVDLTERRASKSIIYVSIQFSYDRDRETYWIRRRTSSFPIWSLQQRKRKTEWEERKRKKKTKAMKGKEKENKKIKWYDMEKWENVKKTIGKGRKKKRKIEEN